MNQLNITNKEFLCAIFGNDFIWAHVTDFFHDPGCEFTDISRAAWLGDYYINYKLHQYANQYFTISLFNVASDHIARRRKELFKATYCIVIDDVGEKIPVDLLFDKPAPSWILETSPGSQQWGYILDIPCTDRVKVEAVLQGLVAKICPKGIDSGMLGVTRYVRLPEGWNTKESKIALNGGELFKCRMIVWQPEIKINLNLFAQTFDLDLNIKQNNQNISDDLPMINHAYHPIWQIITAKEHLGENKFSISCPWQSEHTMQEDTGTLLIIHNNGKLSFKCHHGHCANKTSLDLFHWIEEHPAIMILYQEYCLEIQKQNPVKPCPIKCKKTHTTK